MNGNVAKLLAEAHVSERVLFIALIDPDRLDVSQARERVQMFQDNGVDLIFVGGSLTAVSDFDRYAAEVQAASSVPVVGFPGSTDQISGHLDAILFLSVISGRNPDLLFGQHVHVAAQLKELSIEVISTGYILVESGPLTSAHYMSHSLPIPRSKPSIAASTALAGQLLGLSLMYLDAGSGAEQTVPESMIASVRETCDVPLLVGGGVRSPETAELMVSAGATGIVIGTAFEENPLPDLVRLFASAIHGA